MPEILVATEAAGSPNWGGASMTSGFVPPLRRRGSEFAISSDAGDRTRSQRERRVTPRLCANLPGYPPDVVHRLVLAGLVAVVWLAPGLAGADTFTISSESDLRTALTNAQNGDTISFDADVTLTAGDLPALQKNVTILGNNFRL